MHVSLNNKSGNRKIGAIPVSTTEEASCPPYCPFKDTDCYARFGPLGMHWRKVRPGMRGDNWNGFCSRVRRFPAGQLWRHNQAGDLPQRKDGRLHATKCRSLSLASGHTRGWTYTHYDPTDAHNRRVIAGMNQHGGLTVNLSADSMDQADEYVALGIGPVTVVLPENAPHNGNVTPDGNPVVTCPAQTHELTCEQCKLCQVATRKSIVGFLAHGTASKRLSRRIEMASRTTSTQASA